MFTFSTVVFEVVWEAMRLPGMPARIAVREHGATVDERRHVRHAALADAGSVGLGGPSGFDERLSRLLELLADHDRGVSLRELAGRRRRAYAAARGREGACAVVDGELVTVYPVEGDHLAGELVTLLPVLPAGPGRAVSVPSDVFDAAMTRYADARDSTAARRVLDRAGIDGKDAERVLTTGRDSVASGSIGVHRGGRHAVRLVGSLAYTDTAKGRYAVVRRADPGGRSVTTLVPCDVDGLRRRVRELMASSPR